MKYIYEVHIPKAVDEVHIPSSAYMQIVKVTNTYTYITRPVCDFGRLHHILFFFTSLRSIECNYCVGCFRRSCHLKFSQLIVSLPCFCATFGHPLLCMY